jgi:hypothetical protein
MPSKGGNVRISETVTGTNSEGHRNFLRKVKHRHMALRGWIRNTILIMGPHAKQAKKEKYESLVIQAGKGFSFMRSLIGI